MLYFSACGTRSGVIVLYFPRMERALALLCYIFRMWNTLWLYCVVFSACGTRSSVIVLYFPCVECALALFRYIFPRVERTLALFSYISRAWNALWYFLLISFGVVIYSPCDLTMFISKLS